MSRMKQLFVLLALLSMFLSVPGFRAVADAAEFPDSLIEIGDEAFYGDVSLGEVVIPEGTSTIGKRAFACSSVTEITLPDSLKSIAADAFSGCTRLDTVHIPHGLIGRLDLGELFADTPWLIASGAYDEQIDWCFTNGGTLYITGNGVLYGYSQPWQAYQSQIACVYIGEGITMIDGPAFIGCNAMTACYLPEGLTGIRNEVFRECAGLSSIAFPDSLQAIGDYAFYGCTNLTGITFNSGLKQIGPYAFAFADALQSVTLPEGLQSIAYTAFDAAGSLERIDVDPDNACFASVEGVVYSADRRTLVLCPRACSDVFVIPEGVTEIASGAFSGCRLTGVEFPDSLVIIGEKAFADCRNLRTLTLGSHVEEIRAQAFQTCTELQSISLPASVSVMGSYVFSDCYSLTAIHVAEGSTAFSSADGVLLADNGTKLLFCPKQYSGSFVCPDGVVEIADGAFSACSAVTGVTLPDGLKIIGSGAFNQCSAASVNIPDSVEVIADNAFLNSGLKSVFVPASVKEMGNFAFASSWSLESVILEEGLQSISYGAFNDCTALRSIAIPASVGSIGLHAFSKCTGLGAISVSEANKAYSSVDGVLLNRNGTTLIQYPAGRSAAEYAIPAQVSRIDSYAFVFCDSLQSVSIPEGVTKIGIRAIHDCPALTQILYEGTAAQWAQIYWDAEGNWIVDYDPQEFIAFMNDLVVFKW